MNPMPKSIKLFEQLYLGSLALGIVQCSFFLNELKNANVNTSLIVVFWLILFLALGIIVLLVSRKRNSFCKWILVIMTLGGLYAYIPALSVLITSGFMGFIYLRQIKLFEY
jgi:hypothetical protein